MKTDKIDNEYPSPKEAFDWLRKEIGDDWDKVKCPCAAFLKEEPCELNCPEFNSVTENKQP